MRHTPEHGIGYSAPSAHVPPWLADHYLESYICWREECAAAHHAYEHWNGAERGDPELAFAAYGAAEIARNEPRGCSASASSASVSGSDEPL